MTVTEAGVYAYLPVDLKRPDDVVRDGSGGVTAETYTVLSNNTLVELQARLDYEGVDLSLQNHALLNDAAAMMIAARILRRIRTYQEVADSLFADANIKLRLFFENVALTAEGDAGIAIVLDTDAPPDPYLPDAEEMTQAFLFDIRE